MANESTVGVIYGARATRVVAPEVEGDALWLSTEDLERVSGWALKPQGFCKGEACVPVPPAPQSEFASGGRYNLTALASLLGQPVVHDQAHRVWSFGEASAARRRALTSLEAPDFTLPDLEGRMHSLSEHRGRKVFLVSWASW